MKKRAALSLVVVAVLAALVYSQYRTWSEFDWGTFAKRTVSVNWWLIAAATALIYVGYALRAVRWKTFLGDAAQTRTTALLPAQIVGFTGLALLGRPGELVRPYLIARRLGTSVSSQLAIWTVERLFDMAAFAVLFSATMVAFNDELSGDHADVVRRVGLFFAGIVAVLGAFVWIVRRTPEVWAHRIAALMAPFGPRIRKAAEGKVLGFGEALRAVQGARMALSAAATSLAIWAVIGGAYYLVLRAYGDSLASLRLPHIIMLMAASMAGSLFQLPGVGGGAQLATITVMQRMFRVEISLATSAGILLWLVTFMVCIPVGLLLARTEQTSLREATTNAGAPGRE